MSWLLRVYCLDRTGKTDEAWELLKSQERGEHVRRQSLFAQGHAYLGDLDGCFRLLSKSVDVGDFALQTFRNEPELEFVRADPRFGELLKRAGVP